MWTRFFWLFIFFLLGRHICFPASPRYMELVDSADFYIQRENWVKAEDTILKALRLEPANFTNSLLLANLGIVQIQMGEYLKALENFSLGLNIAPSSTVLLNNRAHTNLLMENFESAILDLDKSLSIDSLQEWPLQTRGYLYLEHGEIQKAEFLFKKLQKEFPKNSSVYSGLATLAEKKGEKSLAKDYYLTALKINPEDEEARESFIYLLITMEDYSVARLQLKEALNKNPENPVFYLLRGYLHRLNYRLDEAEADKKIAISKGMDREYASRFIP